MYLKDSKHPHNFYLLLVIKWSWGMGCDRMGWVIFEFKLKKKYTNKSLSTHSIVVNILI